MARKKRKDPGEGVTVGESGGLGASIGSLLGAETTKSGKSRNEKEDSTGKSARIERPAPQDYSSVTKAVVNRERTGRGGKTVTPVELRGFSGSLESAAKDMRKALGCGSRVEGERIILQGDIGDRAEDWLRKKGVKNVILGNR